MRSFIKFFFWSFTIVVYIFWDEIDQSNVGRFLEMVVLLKFMFTFYYFLHKWSITTLSTVEILRPLQYIKPGSIDHMQII